ncbi:addiction module antidote protein [Geminocystis sp. CENA526]|uniref:addiction module antidote protein n=1 Tax=Geminocystis sp. CENA526 TaxID=1355871 RepID=UPI003D6DC295
MRKYRNLLQVSEEYFRNHPEEIDEFIKEIFEDYATDQDSTALLSGLRIVAQVKGVTNLANQVGMTRQGLQKALSAKGNPRLDNINAILQAMGYQLMPQLLTEISQ